MSPLRLSAVLLASLAVACSAAPPPRSHRPPPAAAASPLLTPARWILTDRLGVMFDEAGRGASLPRREPVIVDGVRLVVDGGLVVASARHADRLTGFRSLPDRLGGGFVLWSEDRVYRAAAFLDDPKPIADVGATGGARPWLSTVLLRTPSGLLELDPRTLSLHRAAWPGVADAVAVDDQRAARVDQLGRASFTIDGGQRFTDLLATRGVRVEGMSAPQGEILFDAASARGLVLGPRGDLRRPAEPDPPPLEARPATPPLDSAFPASSRMLPGEIVAHAVAWGAPLPGGRVLVTRENGVRVLATETGLPVADTDVGAVNERFFRCQAIAVGAPPHPALVCSTTQGSAVITLDGSLARLDLDATFPQQDSGFFTGPRGRLAFDGRCGSEVPTGADLGPGISRAVSDTSDLVQMTSSDATPPPEVPPEIPPDDDARVCLRTAPARWLERRLRGDDARHLYRWVPGDDGAVTALILTGDDEAAPDADEDGAPAKPKPDEDGAPARPKPAADPATKPAAPEPPPEGVRVIRLSSNDPVLKGGAFPAVPPPQRDAPYRTADPDFWQDDDGSIRGWIRLPADGEEKVAAPASPQGAAHRMLRVATSRGGRSAGVRIDAAGHLTVLPLPEGVTEVVTGGPFALAMAPREGDAAWFESLDGGANWTPIEAPPVGRLEAPPDEHAPFACSSLGCAFGNGLVRLGWGSAAPQPVPELTLAPAVNPKLRDPSPPALRCQLDAPEAPWIAAAPKPSAAPPKPKPPAPKPAAPSPKPVAPSAKAAAPSAKPAAPPSKAAPAKPSKSPAKPAPAKPAPSKLPPRDASAKPAAPIALRLSSSPLGELRDHTWTGDVIPPFQPAAALRHLTVTDRTLSTNQGTVIPVLTARPREPLDLLLALDKRRLRATGAASTLPLDASARFTIAADLGPDLVLFDAEHDQLFLARGEAVSQVLRLTRVREVTHTRITLAQKLSGGLALVGYSALSGEVFVGDVDLGRAEVGPLAALPRLDALAVCTDEKARYRFLIDLPIPVRVTGKGGGGEALIDQQVTVALLVTASAERLCVEGVEAALPKGTATVLSATMGKGAAASVRSEGKVVRASCAMGK
ncbi:MAG: hypothetical protein QM820_24890 [Minicystis sp.]